MMKNFVSAGLSILFFAATACGSGASSGKGGASSAGSGKADTTAAAAPDATASTLTGGVDTAGLPGGKVPPASVILGRKEVPILCYHQIRDWKPTDSKVSKDYIMPPADLKAELKIGRAHV